MVRVTTQIERAFRLAVPVEDAWALLADVPAWGALFPHVILVEPFETDLPGTAFLWRMEPLGPPGGRVETVYACRYDAQPESHTLTWTPIPDVGTAQFAGSCALAAEPAPSDASGTATTGRLQMDATLEIPAPSFVRGIVQMAVSLEMERMVGTFLDRLAATLERP